METTRERESESERERANERERTSVGVNSMRGEREQVRGRTSKKERGKESYDE